MRRPFPALFHALTLCACLLSAVPALAQEPASTTTETTVDPALRGVLTGDWRTPANVARDVYRHPAETLTFFGLKPDMRVVEITPGNGWYSEILAPYLRERGHYVAAIVDPTVLPEGGGRDYQQGAKQRLERIFAASPAQYDRVEVVTYNPVAPVFGPPGSVDVVLTFRNVHNWRSQNQAAGMFRGFFAVLKPGGTLGVVEHRAAGTTPEDDKTGYVGQAQVIALAESAGFRLVGASEINANALDTKDYPNGVWSLPPANRHEPEEDARYKAIGESDRMTLRFVKPATP